MLLILGAWLLVSSCVEAQPDKKTQAWAERVLLGPEFGSRTKRCARWMRSPTLTILGGSANERKVVTDVVAHLNETLSHTTIKKIELRPPGDTRADIRVHFAPLEEFPSLAKKYRCSYVQGNWGFFWTFWDRNRRLTSAIVLLATDKLEGKRLRHFALEEITQSLGLSNDSPEFADSIFFSNGRFHGEAQQLSQRDRWLILLLYNHILPNATEADVRKALREHWPRSR